MSIEPFRTERYALLNQCRWNHFISMGIPLAGKTVFEPGAGIGDQTEWLLNQGVSRILVNDGRQENLDIIRERFRGDQRVSFVCADLEVGITDALRDADIKRVDLIFFYGVYYHLRETCPEWHIMRALTHLGDVIVMDYLAGDNNVVEYGYDNPSTSLSRSAFRPRTETLIQGLKEVWGHAYLPKQQLNWVDPSAPETRLVAVASHAPLDNPNLELQ